MKTIEPKTKEEIELMRKSGKIAGAVLKKLLEIAKPGISTSEMNRIAEKIISDAGAKPSFKGFYGYPAGTCISINSEVVHGIPSDRLLKSGDIVGIDVGVNYRGLHTDTAITVGVGEISAEAQRLINVTKLSLEKGLEQIAADRFLGDAQASIQETLEKAGFGVIRDLTGHGVGRELQEEPAIPNYGQKGKGLLLKEGMTLAIEPMASEGDWQVRQLSDGWTFVTADGSLSAHFEHTIVVNKDGCEILTRI